ncbi:hypothetical protein ACUN9W_29030, partial [Escherichia coli]
LHGCIIRRNALVGMNAVVMDGAVIGIVKLVVGVLVIALFENSMARLRLDITPRITWAGFGFAFLAFVSLLAA